MTIIQQLKDIINKPNPLIIEIGCWNGNDTELFLNVFPECKIFGFEPDPRNIERIRAKIKNPRFELIEEAISDMDAQMTFYESHGAINGEKDWSASGSLNKPKEHLSVNPDITFGEGVKVFGRKLDSFTKARQISYIDLIWADVNGAEYKMISGALETLKFTKFLYTEFSEKEIYEGSITKEHIKNMLPNFKEILVHKNNILLGNTL